MAGFDYRNEPVLKSCPEFVSLFHGNHFVITSRTCRCPSGSAISSLHCKCRIKINYFLKNITNRTSYADADWIRMKQTKADSPTALRLTEAICLTRIRNI